MLIANFSDKLLFTMHSGPEINSLQDLRGKVIGVSGMAGPTPTSPRVWLTLKLGLIPDKDVAIRGVGGVAGNCSRAQGEDCASWDIIATVIIRCAKSGVSKFSSICRPSVSIMARQVWGSRKHIAP